MNIKKLVIVVLATTEDFLNAMMIWNFSAFMESLHQKYLQLMNQANQAKTDQQYHVLVKQAEKCLHQYPHNDVFELTVRDGRDQAA